MKTKSIKIVKCIILLSILITSVTLYKILILKILHVNFKINESVHSSNFVTIDSKKNKKISEKTKLLKSQSNELHDSYPGYGGSGYSIKMNYMTTDQKQQYKKNYLQHQFNEYLSRMIPLQRYLKDTRDESCKKIKYPKPVLDTSIIIIFHNEAWSTLLRTVHSVIDTTNGDMVKEIILVDDASNLEHLKTPLDVYTSRLRGVKIVRHLIRRGLIHARLTGEAVATGLTLTFLDSHCECLPNWLEPLLLRVSQNWTFVAMPVIDNINRDTFEFSSTANSDVYVGGFNWKLLFTWHTISYTEMKNSRKDTDPINSPTMAGGLFTIHKTFFNHLGRYDPGMDIWGGENLELSFKIWMCGGSLVTLPCSQVGHVFRTKAPYKSRTGKDSFKINRIRLAEVWLDEYKKYFYSQENVDSVDYGDVSDRKKLRETLKCHSFQWYLENVYPELEIPLDIIYSGLIINNETNFCIDSIEQTYSTLNAYPCGKRGGNQFWTFTEFQEFRKHQVCIDYDGEKLLITTCHRSGGTQAWNFENGLIIHNMTRECMYLSVYEKRVFMRECNNEDPFQEWIWN